MLIANETNSMFMRDEDALLDRKIFVRNLGKLLAQTREGVVSCELDDNEIVTITFRDGYEKTVNVNMNSYLAVIKDVCRYGF